MSCTVPNTVRIASICVMSTASTISASAVQFRLPVVERLEGERGGRHAARFERGRDEEQRERGQSHRGADRDAVVVDLPYAMSESVPTAKNRPTRPAVIRRPLVMIDASRDRGLRFMSPGDAWSKPSAMPSGALTRKLM